MMQKLDDYVPGKLKGRDTQVTLESTAICSNVVQPRQVNYLKRVARYVVYLRNIERLGADVKLDKDRLRRIHQHSAGKQPLEERPSVTVALQTSSMRCSRAAMWDCATCS